MERITLPPFALMAASSFNSCPGSMFRMAPLYRSPNTSVGRAQVPNGMPLRLVEENEGRWTGSAAVTPMPPGESSTLVNRSEELQAVREEATATTPNTLRYGSRRTSDIIFMRSFPGPAWKWATILARQFEGPAPGYAGGGGSSLSADAWPGGARHV